MFNLYDKIKTNVNKKKNEENLKRNISDLDLIQLKKKSKDKIEKIASLIKHIKSNIEKMAMSPESIVFETIGSQEFIVLCDNRAVFGSNDHYLISTNSTSMELKDLLSIDPVLNDLTNEFYSWLSNNGIDSILACYEYGGYGHNRRNSYKILIK